MMRTSEFKSIIQKQEFKYDDNLYTSIGISSDNLVLATVSLVKLGKFEIRHSEKLSKQMIENIVEYAYTPLKERKDEIEATFVPNEIKFATNALDNLITSQLKIQKTEGNVNGVSNKFEITFDNKSDFEMLLRILAKASGTEM